MFLLLFKLRFLVSWRLDGAAARSPAESSSARRDDKAKPGNDKIETRDKSDEHCKVYGRQEYGLRKWFTLVHEFQAPPESEENVSDDGNAKNAGQYYGPMADPALAPWLPFRCWNVEGICVSWTCW